MRRAGGEHDDCAGEDTGQQHDEHVDARHAADEHQQVRERLLILSGPVITAADVKAYALL